MIRSGLNRSVALMWLLFWSVILLNGASLHGAWLPEINPLNPLSMFFYLPPLIVLGSEWAARRNDEALATLNKTLRILVWALAALLTAYLLILAVYAASTI
jgi:hypothetical protein